MLQITWSIHGFGDWGGGQKNDKTDNTESRKINARNAEQSNFEKNGKKKFETEITS